MFNPDSLKMARCIRAKTVDGLAKETGISFRRLNALEDKNNKFAVATEEEINIFAKCLKFPREFFVDAYIVWPEQFSICQAQRYSKIMEMM